MTALYLSDCMFPEETRPYLIAAPSYTHTSSGVRTLYLLCHLLNVTGRSAFIFPLDGHLQKNNLFLHTPYMRCESHLEPIVVYPDIINENPLNAKTVVRYLMAPARHPGSFGEKDMIWGVTSDLAMNTLTIPTFNPKIYFIDAGVKREGECFYAHKYDKIFKNPIPGFLKDVPRVEGTQKQVADMLRSKKTIYVLEMSEIIVTAAMCGCKVVLVRSPYFHTIDVRNEFLKFKGWEWNEGDTPDHQQNVGAMLKHIEDDLMEQLHNFVIGTQNEQFN